MKLSILIATLGRRGYRFLNLLSLLMPQVEKYDGQIEVLAYWNNGEVSIGEIRRSLMESAVGEYVCFIDDDDSVPGYYCAEIMEAIEEHPDYVGFKVQFFNEGVEAKPVFHSIMYNRWHEDERGYYRGVTHLNPIKREIALQGDFGNGGIGEDAKWARSVTPLVKTEKYVDKVMYQYYHDKSDTSFGGDIKPDGNYKRPTVTYKNFSFLVSQKRSQHAANNRV